MFTYKLHKRNIESLSNIIGDIIDKGENEISIIYNNDSNDSDVSIYDDILTWDYNDFNKYQDELMKLINLLKDQYYRDNIVSVDKLTNLIIKKDVDFKSLDKEKFLFCKYCPCTACIVDTELFKKATNVEFIPPMNYSNRSFIEYTAAINF